LEEGGFAYFYFREGRVSGVFASGRPDAERSPMQALVKERAAYDVLADRLGNESMDLADIAGQEAPGGGQGKAGEPKPSFSKDIAPLFRDKDVDEMKEESGLDLSDYEVVRARARAIHGRLSDGSMPCDGPWPEESVAKFKQWMVSGMQP
jgi:hypothetical protein